MMAAASALARPLPYGLARPRRRWMGLSATTSDQELVAFIRRGEGEAIALLVDRYSARVYRYLRGLVGDEALAEDILQDTWLRVVERLDRYDAAQPFLVWLFAVARHRAFDLLRQRAREWRALGKPAEVQENEEGERLDPVEVLAAGGRSPLEEVAEEELGHRVAEAFACLPRHYREVLTLRFQEDLALEEIARLLNLPLSTVKTRVQRGLIQLRQRAEGLGLAPQ